MEPLISVIIPVYKVEEYLPTCIKSVINQTYKNLEIILVDDGSPDNCGVMCDEFAEKDKRIKVIHQKNNGLSSARNVGIDVATGEYIGFVDSDDYIEPDMYAAMMDYMQKNKLDIVCCDTKIIKGTKVKFRPIYKENRLWGGTEALNEILVGAIDNSACNKLYKRECIGKYRFPIGRRYEDVATVYLFFINAGRVGYICQGFYFYLKRRSGIIGNSFNSKSRYECFLGYKERLIYAVENKLACIEDCRVNAVETALATMTAFYAKNEPEDSERFKEVRELLEGNGKKLTKKIKTKHSVLLWSFYNCQCVHKVYAMLSGLSKR